MENVNQTEQVVDKASAAAAAAAAEKAAQKAAEKAAKDAEKAAAKEAKAAEKAAKAAEKEAAKEAAKAAKEAAKAEKEAAKAAKANRVKQPEQNGMKMPKEGTKTRAVWDFCTKASEEAGAPVSRAKVSAHFATLGANPNMVVSQYAYWRKFHGITGRVVDEVVAPAPASENV